MIKKAISVIFLAVTCISAFAQQHSVYSQYIFNLYTVNPAYAGERDALSTALSYRTQWVGFDGAPRTQNFSIHSPLKNNNMALGLFLQNDIIGARSTPAVMGTYAYKIKLNNISHLSFGLQGGVMNYQYHWEDLNYRQGLDPVSFGTEGNKWIANFDFGVMYLTAKSYLGLSVLSINNAKMIAAEESDAHLSTVYNFIAGKMYKVSEDIFLKPSTIIRTYIQGPTQFDINLGAFFKNRYWLTGTYRYKYGAVLSAHIFVNENFHFGYAYDLPLNPLLSSQSGTHEIFVGYEFNIYKKKALKPNYY